LGIPTKEAELYTMDTISIEFPAVKVNLPIDDITFDTLEQMVFDITQRIGRKTTEKALHDIDEALRISRPKGALENTGKRAKYFLTRLGDIRYLRTRYIDKATGESRYLLEEKLKIAKNQRISLTRAKIEMLIASLTTYRGTEKDVELLTGYRRSHESIRQSVIKEAERIIAYQESAIEKVRRLEDGKEPDTVHDIIYLESDSAFIRMQRRRKRRSGKVIYHRRRKSIEVKMGVGYTDKIRRYAHGRTGALKLKDKFVYASIGNGKTFMENLSLIAEKRLGLSWAKTVIFGGDGASYITSGIKDYFVNAIYKLCDFHLKRNIKRCLPFRPNVQDRINGLLKKDKIDKALSILERLAKATSSRKDKWSIRELYAYINQNKDGINPLNRIEDKSIRNKIKGTGAMESNIDKFVANRFKKRGMSWSEKGALSLLKVKETISNGEWDSWWLRGRDQKIEIRPEPLKALTAKNFWMQPKNTLPLVEATIPALQGPDRNEPWAKVIRQLSDIDYYRQN
jgi:hypothetical protein